MNKCHFFVKQKISCSTLFEQFFKPLGSRNSNLYLHFPEFEAIFPEAWFVLPALNGNARCTVGVPGAFFNQNATVAAENQVAGVFDSVDAPVGNQHPIPLPPHQKVVVSEPGHAHHVRPELADGHLGANKTLLLQKHHSDVQLVFRLHVI
jgi:hypothetical protein